MLCGLVLRERRDGEKLIVKAGGPLTADALMYIQSFIATHLRRRGASVVILDLTGCVHVLSDEQMSQAARAATSGVNCIPLPVVLVVPPAFEAMADRYCARAATLGLMRMCYLTFSEAMEWASDAQEWPS